MGARESTTWGHVMRDFSKNTFLVSASALAFAMPANAQPVDEPQQAPPPVGQNLPSAIDQQSRAARSQQDSAEDRLEVEEIVVTGTNTRRPAVDALVPVQVVDRQEIIRVGAAQFSDLLRTIPSNTGTALYNEGGRLGGTAQFDLRGLGFSSTLVLLNGRRAGVAPLSDRTGADFLDINQFPLAMVRRIDVLKDGSSAIYGSEAVAGVVNIITRRGFEGFELSAEYQNATNEVYALNLAAGAGNDRATFNVYATYYHQSGNVRSDFDWLIKRIGGNGTPGRSQLLSVNGYPGTYSLATFNAARQPVAVFGAPTSPDPNCEAAGGVFAIADSGVVNRSTCRFDFTDQIAVIPAARRLQGFVEFTYDLTDRLSFYNETNAAKNLNLSDEQPSSFANGSVAGSGNIFVPASHPFNFFVADPSRPNGIRYVDPSQFNPAVNVAVPLVANLRPEGTVFEGRVRQQNTYVRALNGLRLQAPHDWVATASHQYAYARFDEQRPVSFNADAINRLVLEGRYNPFATSVVSPGLVSPKDGSSVAANNQAVIDQLFYTSKVLRQTDQHVVDVNATGPLLRLPSGDIALAVGGQYRELKLRAVPDSLAAAGRADRPVTEAPVFGKQEVKSAFAELVIPYGDRAQLQLAVRHDDYAGAVGASTDPKIAGRVKLLDGLAVRGSWGTSFQAPTLTQTSTSAAREIINDPVVVTAQGLACSSASVGRGTLVTTNGEDLKPQKSENLTAGIDVTPTRGLRFTVDYWRYDYENLIAAGQNGQAIVSGQCVNGQFRPDPRVQRDGTGQLFGVTTSYVNVGKVVTDGLDISATYTIPTKKLGSFFLRADATYVRNFDVTGGNGIKSDRVGSRNFTTNFAPIPEWRASGAATWEMGDHRFSVGVQYTDGYKNDQSNNAPIDSFTTVDLQYALRLNALLGSATTLAIGANNVFDSKPPALVRYDASGKLISGTVSDIDRPGYDALAGADIRGRLLYLRLTQAF